MIYGTNSYDNYCNATLLMAATGVPANHFNGLTQGLAVQTFQMEISSDTQTYHYI